MIFKLEINSQSEQSLPNFKFSVVDMLKDAEIALLWKSVNPNEEFSLCDSKGNEVGHFKIDDSDYQLT